MSNEVWSMDSSGVGVSGFDRSAAAGVERDLSQIVFKPGNNTGVAEFLQVLPRIKGRPVIVSEAVDTTTALQVSVQRADNAISSVPLYTDGSTVTSGVTELAAAQTFTLARIGLQVSALKIDALAAPKNASRNPVESRVTAAVTDLFRQLDALLAVGAPLAMPSFVTLTTLAGLRGTASVTPAAPDVAAMQCLVNIFPTGRGPGEGPHCLIGNNAALLALMQTAAGQSSTSGWRHDPRIGSLVYHFMGVPFYRAPLATSESNTTTLIAANLGSTGLCLVHGYGTTASCGFQVDEEPTVASGAARGYVVHGAFALVAWEMEAIYGYANVDVSAGAG